VSQINISLYPLREILHIISLVFAPTITHIKQPIMAPKKTEKVVASKESSKIGPKSGPKMEPQVGSQTGPKMELQIGSQTGPKKTNSKTKPKTTTDQNDRESFDNIYLDLSKESGKCRFAESGFGWKPSTGGDTFTLDVSNIGGAQWSRAAKGYEVKILQRNSGIVQLDGFQQEVRGISIVSMAMLTRTGL
jgi:hypothetical protein